MASNYSDELKRKVRDMMISGESDTQISKVTSITTDTLRKWRRKFGLDPSSGGNNNYSQDVKNRCYELMNENKTNAEISKIMDISTTTLANWRKAAGIPNSTASNNSGKYSKEIMTEAIALMQDGLSNSEVSRLLGVHRKTLSNWRTKSNIPPSSRSRASYTIDQINDVIDLIREGNTISQISKISGVNKNKIKQIREEEIRNGNPLPDFVKGISRNQKYSDEEVIELVYLNPGYGLKRFTKLLSISQNFLFDLSLDFKDFTEGKEDLIAILQDESYGKMVSRHEYFEITGNNVAPRGSGSSTGGRTSKPERLGPKGRILKDVFLPPQNFEWGSVKPRAWEDQRKKQIIWIQHRLAKKGYISSIEDKKDFIDETGAGKTKFNHWMKKAGLVFDKKTNRWYKQY